jgi:hypothetical protein
LNKPARGAEIEQTHGVITHERLRVGMSWLAQNFDFTRGDTIVRLIAGLFLVPHIYAKLAGSGTVGFFKAAGFKPPAFVEYIPYHIGISKSVTHRVYRDAEHPSHLLLPIILKRSEGSVSR